MALENRADRSRECDDETDSWTLFETRLAAYLTTMSHPSDTDRLALTIPMDNLAGSAARIGDTIRFRYRLPHPGLMTATAEGPATGGLSILGLGESADIEAASLLAPSAATVHEAIWATDREELAGVILDHLLRPGSRSRRASRSSGCGTSR